METWIPAVVALIGIIPGVIAAVASIETNQKAKKTDLAGKIEALGSKVDSHIAYDAENTALHWRTQIRRYATELRLADKPIATEGMLLDMIAIVEKYNKYCEAHKDFANGVTKDDAETIQDYYEDCKHKRNGRTFLV